MTLTDRPPPPPAPPRTPAASSAPSAPAGRVTPRASVPASKPTAAPSGDDYVDRGAALTRLPKLPFEFVLVVVIGAILLGVFTVLGRISLGDAQDRADAAEAQLALVRTEAVATQDVDPSADEIAALETDVSNLREQLAAATADAGDSTPAVSDSAAAAEIDTLQSSVDDLTTQLTTAEDANDDLTADLDTAETALADLQGSSDADAPAVTAQDSDAFSQYVGELVSSADGLRINPEQSRCLGRAVIDDIGVEAFSAGMSSSRSSTTNDVVIDSVVAGVAECGIDATRVFHQ